ncbi:MAG: ABC transporter permease [Pseudomonadota bacterium]
MIAAGLRALLAHWRRNPLQLFAFLAGLALATALWSGVQAINAEARASYDAAAAVLGEGQYDQILPRRGDSIDQAQYVALRRAGWLVSPVIEGRLNGVRLVGVEPVTAPTGLGGLSINDRPANAVLGPAGPIFANAETAARLASMPALDRPGPGRTQPQHRETDSPEPDSPAQDALGPNRLEPDRVEVVIDPSVAPGLAVGDIGVVQRLLARSDLTRLIVLPQQPRAQPALADVAPALLLQPSAQAADIGQLTDSFHLNLTAFGFLSFSVGLFIVHSTIGLAFEQRRSMVRTLRALGMPMRLLVGLIAAEMLGLAAIGAAIGVMLGYLIAALLLPDVAATLRGLYGAQVSGSLQLRAEWWLSGFLLALLGTAAALAGRIWQIARMPLLTAGRPRAWVLANARRLRLQGRAALVLLAGAAVLAGLADGLASGFALLGALLLGAALALPPLAERALRLVQDRIAAPVWRWFWADTRQQLPGLSLALMALLLAVSANIGVSTMVSSFRVTFVGFLDQRLAPELFVRVETAQASAALERYLSARGHELLPLLATPTRIAGQPTRLFGVRVGPTYRENWRFLAAEPAAWDRVEAGAAVIVNEQLARRAGLWTGDRLAITEGLRLPIVGVVGDYGNPNGQAVIAEPLFRSLHPDLFARQFGVRTQTPQTLRAALGDSRGISINAIIDQAAIKRASLQVFERTFLVTDALNLLTLGVAGFAILMSLLTLADQRVPQLAPVWALGLTRKRLGALELLRAVALAVIVFLCALPVGLGLAWVLLSIVNVAAFGWQLPMFFFPFDYAMLGLYAIIAALLAASWPALRLARTPLATLLKVFANER